jgi:hypothetical protein
MAPHPGGTILDLKRLRYFCVIVEQGSISKAAQLLCMSQPPLSKRLQHPVAARLSTGIEIPEVTATLAGFLKH